jgi:hypothetical protein
MRPRPHGGNREPEGQLSVTTPPRDPSPDPAASPSRVASGDRSAAEPSDPSLATTNGRPCRHHNDSATCAICSDAPGSPPPKAALDQALGRVRDAAADDPKAAP